MRLLPRLLPALVLAGCTVVETPTQSLRLIAEPAETVCTVARAGERLGEIAAGRPLDVDASRAPLVLGCSAPGHEPAQFVVSSAGPRAGVLGAAASGFELLDLPGERFTRYADPIVIRLRTAPTRTATR
jgi:hypothetical protein